MFDQKREGEPLDPELEMYLTETGFMGEALKHPLVFQVPFFPQLRYLANDMLAAKREALDKAKTDGNWSHAIYLHERPYRSNAFDAYKRHMDDATYWDILGDVYSDTENFWQESRRWARLLASGRPERDHFMNEADREHFASLPDELAVYRGFNGKGKAASWAWTLDKEIAAWFAKRLNRVDYFKPPTVVTGTVAKTDVIGYISSRHEDEIVADPKKVTITNTQKADDD